MIGCAKGGTDSCTGVRGGSLPFQFDHDVVELGLVAIHGCLAAAQAPVDCACGAVAGLGCASGLNDLGVHVGEEDDYAGALVDEGALFSEGKLQMDNADTIVFENNFI